MKGLLILLTILLLVPLLLLGTILLAPSIVLPPLANLWLVESGIQVKSLEGVHLGWRETSASGVQFDAQGMLVDVGDVGLSYRLRQLLTGKLNGITIDTVSVTPRTTEAATGPGDRVLEELLAPLSGLPLTSLSVGELRYKGNPELTAELSVTTAPLQLSGRLTSAENASQALAFSLQETAPRQFTGNLTATTAEEELLSADLEATVQNDDLNVVLETNLNLDVLQAVPDLASFLEGVAVDSGPLRLDSRLRLQSLSSEPSLAELDLTLDNALSSARVAWQQAESSLSALLTLPLQITGSSGTNLQNLSLLLNRMAGQVTFNSGTASLQSDLTAEQLELSCPELPVCNLTLTADLAIAEWQAGPVSGNAARLTGPYTLAIDGAVTRLSSPSISLNLPEIRIDDQVAAAEIQLRNLLVDLPGQTLSSDFATTRLDPGIEGLTLNNPGLEGRLTAGSTALSADLTLNLNNRLQATLQIEQALADGSPGNGSAKLTLQNYVFTDSFNLASLVSYAGLDLDLVAGSLDGDATINWQPGDDGNWRLSGPLHVALNEVSGIVADSFFVGLDTELRAGITDGPGLASDGLLDATLATVDVGLPLNRIDWRYGFDTRAGLYNLRDLHTDLLGGSLQIADFQYDINASQNRLQVALVNLDLATIVALANYPNLQVSGAISGYIPLLIAPGGITVEQGLVSALNPGGSIRYTANSTAIGNAGLELINQALSNYQFDNLDSEVSYDENGELEMAVHLKGRNPEFEDGRRINLNVTISDNIPTLLESLQAGRVITERLEQRLNSQ
ncbi:MAG: YdbH domain-containing protein [Pseudomonadales bacterium]|nr:YdbH domain-containing protein [Pseudomonadales bacterium]